MATAQPLGARVAKEFTLLTAEATRIDGVTVEVVPEEKIADRHNGDVASPPSWGSKVAVVWNVSISKPPLLHGTPYEGETYDLRVAFDDDYPRTAPIMTFGKLKPVHEHVYTNGMLCLEPLYTSGGWNGATSTVRSVLLSILVMLRGTPPHLKRRHATDASFSMCVCRVVRRRGRAMLGAGDCASWQRDVVPVRKRTKV
jgi:ubiquitin-protein ligase